MGGTQLRESLLGERRPKVVKGLAKVRLCKMTQVGREEVCSGMCYRTVLSAAPLAFRRLRTLLEERLVPRAKEDRANTDEPTVKLSLFRDSHNLPTPKQEGKILRKVFLRTAHTKSFVPELEKFVSKRGKVSLQQGSLMGQPTVETRTAFGTQQCLSKVAARRLLKGRLLTAAAATSHQADLAC